MPLGKRRVTPTRFHDSMINVRFAKKRERARRPRHPRETQVAVNGNMASACKWLVWVPLYLGLKNAHSSAQKPYDNSWGF